MEMKKLPVAAEVAIAGAIREVADIAGADRLVVDAIVQNIVAELDRKGFEVREGFKFVAKGVIDLGGVDKMKALRDRAAGL